MLVQEPVAYSGWFKPKVRHRYKYGFKPFFKPKLTLKRKYILPVIPSPILVPRPIKQTKEKGKTIQDIFNYITKNLRYITKIIAFTGNERVAIKLYPELPYLEAEVTTTKLMKQQDAVQYIKDYIAKNNPKVVEIKARPAIGWAKQRVAFKKVNDHYIEIKGVPPWEFKRFVSFKPRYRVMPV